MDASETIRVFISYSHDSQEHMDRVLALADRLRSDGIDCAIDQYEISPPEGWPVWMVKQIKNSNFTVLVCTELYKNRFDREIEETDKGFGVTWESSFIIQQIYYQHTKNDHFIPVVFTHDDLQSIPQILKSYSHYDVSTPQGYEDLLRYITNQPATPKPALGKRKPLPPKPRKTLFEIPKINITFNLPPRNPFFTGREDILTQIHQAFQQGGALAINQAIKGLGGVGKTQTAVEYAYRFRHEYDYIFWARAEKSGDLYTDFADFGKRLGIIPEGCKDKEAFAVMRDWLGENRGWLLVLDNVEDIAEARAALPSPCLGHALITTRSKAVGDFHGIKLDCLPDKEGALLLLRRSKAIGENDPLDAAPVPKRTQALALTRELGGLPLALDQAGAYLEYDCSLDEYLQIYQKNKKLLADRGELYKNTHPDSVTVTFAMCFEKVQKASPAAADLLRICAFLAPDRIPEEIFTEGADELPETLASIAGDTQTWLKHLRFATKYSLIERDTENKILTLHRLVQTVIREEMTESERKEWVERCVRILNKVYPDPEFENWPKCARLSPHAQALFAWIEKYRIETVEAERLGDQTAYYLYNQARYVEAEPLYLRAIAIDEKALGADHPQLAIYLNNLAELYRAQGKYTEAEPLYLRTIAIDEKALGADHPGLAIDLNNLAGLYRAQGKYAEAEPLYLWAIAIHGKALGADHPQLATHLNNLAVLYRAQGKYAEAEPLYLRAIAIDEKALGADHPQLATHLNNLAELYRAQGKYAEAEPLYLRAIAIDEKALGADHPGLATNLNNLALLYDSQSKFTEAESLFLQALLILEKTLPGDHPNLVTGYENYAYFLQKTGRDVEAEEYFRKAREIRERRGEGGGMRVF